MLETPTTVVNPNLITQFLCKSEALLRQFVNEHNSEMGVGTSKLDVQYNWKREATDLYAMLTAEGKPIEREKVGYVFEQAYKAGYMLGHERAIAVIRDTARKLGTPFNFAAMALIARLPKYKASSESIARALIAIVTPTSNPRESAVPVARPPSLRDIERSNKAFTTYVLKSVPQYKRPTKASKVRKGKK